MIMMTKRLIPTARLGRMDGARTPMGSTKNSPSVGVFGRAESGPPLVNPENQAEQRGERADHRITKEELEERPQQRDR